MLRLGGRPHYPIAVALVVAAAAAYLLTDLAGTNLLLSLLHRLDPVWLPVCFGGEVLAYLGYVLAARDMARVDGGPRLSLMLTTKTVVAGFGVFAATHASGGFAVDYWTLRRAGLRKDEAMARVLGLGALEYAALAPAALVAALVLLFEGSRIQQALTLPWLAVLPGFALAAWASAPCRRERFARLASRGFFCRSISHAVAGVAMLRALAFSPRRHVAGIVGVALYWYGDIVCLWAALHVFYAHTPPIAQLLVGYATGYALTRRTLPLGGAGVVESLLPFALGWVAIQRAPAVLAVAFYRAVNLWLPLLPALAGIPQLRRLERGSLRRTARA